MTLQGKTAVITGGGSGIGEAIARALALAGARVAIGGRREAKLREVAESIKGEQAVQFHLLDVADRGSVSQFFEWADQALGRVDILVNCAGINVPRRTMAETVPDEWEKVLAVNATGAFHCMQAVLPQMRRRRDGLIVNISSTSGKRATAMGGIAYSASKFAMTALGTAVASEEAPHGVRVSNVCPGEVDTPILENRPVKVSAEHRARILQPEDVAAAVLMIANLPPRAHVAELIIKPIGQGYA